MQQVSAHRSWTGMECGLGLGVGQSTSDPPCQLFRSDSLALTVYSLVQPMVRDLSPDSRVAAEDRTASSSGECWGCCSCHPSASCILIRMRRRVALRETEALQQVGGAEMRAYLMHLLNAVG